jgi:hypothetical protein
MILFVYVGVMCLGEYDFCGVKADFQSSHEAPRCE